MRRFRNLRMRRAALALLPLTALTATTTLATAKPAQRASIDVSSRSVPVGEEVILRGSFPEASNAAVVVRQRTAGSNRWRVSARTRTGAGGRWSTRALPRRSGLWRAELAGTVEPQTAAGTAGEESAPASPANTGDRATGTERIAVRSRTETRLSRRHALAGRVFRVRGTVAPAGASRRVIVRIGSKRLRTRAGRDGRFALAWRAPRPGSYPVRISARSNRFATGSRDSAGSVTAYRSAAASWYGPGLYGNKLACGGTLTPSTIGVAHKTMPCGTKLRLRYGRRTVAVRVIDRGPFSGDREFDLTSATKQALGFPDLGTVLTSR